MELLSPELQNIFFSNAAPEVNGAAVRKTQDDLGWPERQIGGENFHHRTRGKIFPWEIPTVDGWNPAN